MGLFQENHDEGEDGHLNEGVQHAGDGQGRQSAFPQYNHQRASDPGEADAVVRLSVVIEVTAKKLQSPDVMSGKRATARIATRQS